jgi:hypothetical protein
MFPVPSCLIIRAENIENAKKIAHKTITHAKINDIKEIELDGEGVVIYLSGDY